MRLRHAAALAVLPLTGCWDMDQGKDAKIPGDLLGDYSVASTLQTSTCGPGALSMPDRNTFQVRLSRDGSDLYWLNGKEAIPGDVAADGVSFTFDTRVQIEATQKSQVRAGCTISRRDQSSGKLSSSSKSVASFTGSLQFSFEPQAGSDCNEFMLEAGFVALPCEMTYTMSATRTGP